MGRLPGSWDPPAWGGPWKGLLLAASVLGSCLQPVPAQTQTPVTIVLTPPSPVVGEGVSLAPQPTPQNVVLCNWYRSATADQSSLILTYSPTTSPPQSNGPAHTGRETAGPGCVLNIAGLTLSDSGSYTVQIQTPASHYIGVNLTIYEKLAKPTVTPNQTQVPENGNFTLMCSTSPSADTVLWLHDGSYFAPTKRLGLSPDNRTLTVSNVTRGDSGTYQCEVTNPVSTNRSEPSTVTVAYGPDSARIDPPGPISLTLGSSAVTLLCVADSFPAPSYRWVLNGTDTNEMGSSLTINPTTLAHQGTYECQAQNPVTNRTARASVAVRFTAPGSGSSQGLSPGAIAGIVIGVLAGAALVGGLLYFLLCKTGGGPKQHSPAGGQAAPGHNQGVGDNKPTLGVEDIQYSTLAFAAGDQKPPSGPQPRPESGTVYSEIRKK